ncbi:MAG: hypothetical protein ACYSUM_01550 [Planctomycetota bacterium]|jgi:hypothetical protein
MRRVSLASPSVTVFCSARASASAAVSSGSFSAAAVRLSAREVRHLEELLVRVAGPDATVLQRAPE